MAAWRAPGAVLLAAAIGVVGGCGTAPFGPSIEIPAGLAHRMSVDQVEAVVHTMVVGNVARLGRELRPFRMTRIRLVPPGHRYVLANADGSPGGGLIVEDLAYWAVEVDGTFHECGTTGSGCAAYSRGAVIIDDATGQQRGWAPREIPVRLP